MPVSSKPRKKRNQKKRGLKKARAFPGYEMTATLMKEKGIKGDPRNYVILHIDKLIDGERRTNITIPDMEQPFPSIPTLVHKKRLAKWVGDEVAAMFWNPKLGGFRVPQKRSMEMVAERLKQKLEEAEGEEDDSSK